MFWDRVAFIYDIFADVINAKTHRRLCEIVADEIESDDDVIVGNVIHLLDEPYRALQELDRVCRSGGRLYGCELYNDRGQSALCGSRDSEGM